MRGYGGDEILGPGSRGLDVFGADLEHVFEVGGDVGQFALQHEDDVFVVFAFLVRFGMLGSGEGLQGGDLLVEGREVLFYYEGEFVDFDGSVVEEGFAFGHCFCLLVFNYLFPSRCRREGRRTFS